MSAELTNPEVLKLMSVKLRVQLNDNRAATQALVRQAAEGMTPPVLESDADAAVEWAFNLDPYDIDTARLHGSLRDLLTLS